MNDKPEPPSVPNSLRYWQSEADSFQAVVGAVDAALPLQQPFLILACGRISGTKHRYHHG